MATAARNLLWSTLCAVTIAASSGSEVARGVWLVDSSAANLSYVDNQFEVGSLQKGAPTALPALTTTDLQQSWSGDRATTTDNFAALTSTSASGSCTAEASTST